MPTQTDSAHQVAVPVPLRQIFDYRWDAALEAGTRVLVPFGSRHIVGVVVSSNPATPGRRIKSILQVLDEDSPTIGGAMLDLLHWAARYQHHPLGEVFATGMPVQLRAARTLEPPAGDTMVRAVSAPDADALAGLSRAPKQRQLYQFVDSRQWRSWNGISGLSGCGRSILKGLQDRGLVQVSRGLPEFTVPAKPLDIELSPEQAEATERIVSARGGYRSFLLQGITGSGKTEVYLAAARQCIEAGEQVLFLVPEISLTPQLVARVREHLGPGVRSLHSGMTNRERYKTWWLAREGRIPAVLGTRSAVFTPLAHPGLIVVDEEHDSSYKQQDGFRYHARNLAIKRGSLEKVPVVLGSATPSLESLHNARQGRHTLLELRERYGSAGLPAIRIVDTGIHPPTNGLSTPLLEAIGERLERKEQTIVYVNRRGYAPVVHCYQCGWQAACRHCAARLVYHRQQDQFRCHHCGWKQPSDPRCPRCDTPLFLGGVGTQRLEQALLGRFPAARLCRLDRDEAGTAGKLYRKLEQIRTGAVDIVIGTQLITKGHDFGRVSLVCVVSADQGLYSVDFRGPETLFQQLLQVAGRAGRAEVPGEVLVQTAHPDHPCIRLLAVHDYPGFADVELAQRRQAGYPPFAHFALFRAESDDSEAGLDFLSQVEQLGRDIHRSRPESNVEILPAIPAPLERVAGRYRFQLLVRASRREPLHHLLDQWAAEIDVRLTRRNVRWSLDVDPTEML